ncbi:MAG: glycosyltransferase family 61 protein, partial [Pseudomonadota bacterium]
GPPRGRRLLISRAGQTTRRVLNEADLAARLAPLGFETVRPETYSHAEQVRLFHDAELVIAVTGAALTNLLFCPPSCTVIELRARDSGQSLYAGLSLQLGLRHRMVDCESHGSARDVTVDPEVVVSVARDLLEDAPDEQRRPVGDGR